MFNKTDNTLTHKRSSYKQRVLIGGAALALSLTSLLPVCAQALENAITYSNNAGTTNTITYNATTHNRYRGIFPIGFDWSNFADSGVYAQGGWLNLNRFGAWSAVPDLVTNDAAQSSNRDTLIAYWKEHGDELIRAGNTIDPALLAGDGLTLYEQWVDGLALFNASSAFDAKNEGPGKPNIKTNNETSEYESKETAYPLDHTQTLKYKAYLDYYDIANYMWTLWARIDKVKSWNGTVDAYFDARADFDKTITVALASTWLIPDEAQLAAAGVEGVKEAQVPRTDGTTGQIIPGTTKGWKFTFNTTELENHIETIEGKPYYHFQIPVKLIDKAAFVDQLTFSEFMEPMVLSVMEDYEKGVNAAITPESVNAIASGDDPYIQTKGKIKLTINTDFMGMAFTLDLSAKDEFAKLYPTGLVDVDFKEYKDGAVQTEDLRATETLEGRAKRDDYPDTDAQNYAETYDLLADPTTAAEKTTYLSSVYTSNIPEGYSFVGYRVNKGKTLQINPGDASGTYSDAVDTRDSAVAGTIYLKDQPGYTDEYLKRAFALGSYDSITLLYSKEVPAPEPTPDPDPQPEPTTESEGTPESEAAAEQETIVAAPSAEKIPETSDPLSAVASMSAAAGSAVLLARRKRW